MLGSLTVNIKNFINRNALRREIFAVITLKLLAIFALWYFFFSHPTDHSLSVGMLVDRYFAK